MRRKLIGTAVSVLVLHVLVLMLVAAAPAATEKVIYSFTGGKDGAQPESDLIADSEGNLYGTTLRGGSTGNGTVFELKHSKEGWKEQVLYSFAGGPTDGLFPQGGLVFDKAGNLYGTTAQGGTSNLGTIFELSPNSNGGWTERVLYSYNPQSGALPQASLVMDGAGNLYGTTSSGQSDNSEVFELKRQSDDSWTEIVLHSFGGAPDGYDTSSSLLLDSFGNLYGTTIYGGSGLCNPHGGREAPPHGCGAVFKLSPGSNGTWSESVIYSFTRGGGYAVNPSGGLMLDEHGDLLGVSKAGGDVWGTVFKLTKSKKGWEQTVLWRFYGVPDGLFALGNLATDPDGDLFGVTSSGGEPGAVGTVFELKRSKNGGRAERVLHSFTGTPDGSQPQSGLLYLKGYLYGTTPQGGVTGCDGQGCGTVFEVTP